MMKQRNNSLSKYMMMKMAYPRSRKSLMTRFTTRLHSRDATDSKKEAVTTQTTKTSKHLSLMKTRRSRELAHLEVGTLD